MAVTIKTTQVVLSTSSTNIISAVGTGKRVRIILILVGNHNSATKYFNIYKLPSGASESDQYLLGGKNKKLDGTSSGLYGGGEWMSGIPFQLDVGEKLTGIAESTSSINVFVSYFEEDV